MTVDTLITGGQLVQPDGVLDASIAIADEKIVAIGSESELPAADQEIDASGKLVLPGAVDVHVISMICSQTIHTRRPQRRLP